MYCTGFINLENSFFANAFVRWQGCGGTNDDLQFDLVNNRADKRVICEVSSDIPHFFEEIDLRIPRDDSDRSG